MSFTASSPTQFFSVVGPAYVAENHDGLGHLPARSEREQIRLGVTSLWVSLFASFGVSLFGAGHAAKAVQIDTRTLH